MLPGLSQASTFCPQAGGRLLSRLCRSSGLLCLLSSGVLAAFKHCHRLGELTLFPPQALGLAVWTLTHCKSQLGWGRSCCRVQAAEEEEGMLLPEGRGRSLPIASSDEPSPRWSLRRRTWAPLGRPRVPKHLCCFTPFILVPNRPKSGFFPSARGGEATRWQRYLQPGRFSGGRSGSGAGGAPGAAGTARSPAPCGGAWPGDRPGATSEPRPTSVREENELSLNHFNSRSLVSPLTANWLQRREMSHHRAER